VDYRKESAGFVIILKQDDSFFESILSLTEHEKIDAAFFWGIGAVKDIVLGYYDLGEKRYIKREYPGVWELVSLFGNLALLEGERLLHAHGVLSNDAMETIGGHIFGFTTAATVELFMIPLKNPMQRGFDKETGLNLLTL
jgi:predicted DNA-binding protein with PD1-like motif